MSDIYEKILNQLNEYGQTITEKSNIAFKNVFSKGEIYAQKGKIQIEIEKLKWELKKYHNELGEHISTQNENENVSDFSHDDIFILLNSKIKKLKAYIKKRETDRTEVNKNKRHTEREN